MGKKKKKEKDKEEKRRRRRKRKKKKEKKKKKKKRRSISANRIPPDVVFVCSQRRTCLCIIDAQLQQLIQAVNHAVRNRFRDDKSVLLSEFVLTHDIPPSVSLLEQLVKV